MTFFPLFGLQMLFLKQYRLWLMQLAGHAVSYGDVYSPIRFPGPRVERACLNSC